MATNIWLELPVEGGGGSGVTSINGATGPAITVAGGTGITVSTVGNTITINDVDSGGTVTSVGLSDGSSTPIYSISGSPVTTSGTLTFSLSTQSANTVFSGPSSGGSAQPTFRTLVAADLPTGNLTDIGTDGITITSGTGSVIGSGTSISQHVADTTHNGYLSSTDWNTFNGKQASGNYITALTGDVSATGPGSVAATLATVNSNVGSFGSSTAIPSFTVNGKGLITAASTNVVIAPAGTLTGTTLASNIVTSSLTSVGTITSGTWNGTTIAIANGGTGSTTQNFVDLTTVQSIAGAKTFTSNTLIAQATASEATIGVVGSTALHDMNGGFEVTTRTTSSNLTIDTTTTDYIIFVNTSGGVVTLTLPVPTSGRMLIIKDSTGSFNTNNCTLARNSTEQIEGVAASKLLTTNWGSYAITSDGTNWFLI